MENKELSLENTLTESMIEAQSTPMTTRVKELSMEDMFNFMKTISDNLSSFNVKFDVQNSKFDEQNDKFDIQNSKFDEMTTQNVKFESNMNVYV